MELKMNRTDDTIEYDVGILGYWFNKNYGAVLTAYALYKVVEQLGYKPVLLDLPLMMEKIEGDYCDDTEAGRQFIVQNCNVSDRYTHRFQLSNLNQKVRVFLVGSDQFWHTCKNQYRNKGGEFFLDFVDDCKKKLSYATSFGEDEFKGTFFDKKILSRLLRRFDGVSVREKSARDICRDVFGVEADVLPDPIFLHNKEFYENLTQNELDIDKDKEYLLVYLLHPTARKQELIKQLAEEFNLKLIVIPDANENYKKYEGCVDWMVNLTSDTTIPQWINYFRNAKYVVTDSYHGVVFSLVFEKQFLGLYPRNGVDRFCSLAELVQIEDRVCFQGTKEQAAAILKKEISYETISSILQREKNAAREWLRQKLSLQKECEGLRDIEIERYRQDTSASALSRSVNARLQHHMQIVKGKNQKLQGEIIKNRKLLLCLFLKEFLSGKRVVIRGAGIHTIELLKLLPSDCQVIGVVAKEIKMQYIGELKVYDSFDDFEEEEIDYVVISTYRYAQEIEYELSNTKYKQKIFNLYTELEKKGITFGKEFYKM